MKLEIDPSAYMCLCVLVGDKSKFAYVIKIISSSAPKAHPSMGATVGSKIVKTSPLCHQSHCCTDI